MVIEGSIGMNYQGDIAVDDVAITDGACPPPGGCSFENGPCGYVNMELDDLDWMIGSASTPSWYQGPKTDHTTNAPAGTVYTLIWLVEY